MTDAQFIALRHTALRRARFRQVRRYLLEGLIMAAVGGLAWFLLLASAY